MSERSPIQQAEELFERILKGKELHERFESYFKKNITISGQTIDYWNDYFRFDIPQDISLKEAQQLAAKLMGLLQTASFYFSVATTKVSLMKRGHQSSFLAKFASIVEEHKSRGGRLPSAQTLETLAKIDGDAAESAYTIADVELKFWKEKLNNLDSSRKLLESVTTSIATELKYLRAEKGLDDVESKYGGYNHE